MSSSILFWTFVRVLVGYCAILSYKYHFYPFFKCSLAICVTDSHKARKIFLNPFEIFPDRQIQFNRCIAQASTWTTVASRTLFEWFSVHNRPLRVSSVTIFFYIAVCNVPLLFCSCNAYTSKSKKKKKLGITKSDQTCFK